VRLGLNRGICHTEYHSCIRIILFIDHVLVIFISSVYHSRISTDPESRIDARRDLACRVRALRLERFLTQDELSELSGVGRATVARIEGGKTVPQARIIKALARALDVGPMDLVREPQRLWGDIQ
jgi:DNA-binding XRE family transcriptional regulator